MDVELRIRDAELFDAAELAALACELGYKTTTAEMESRLVSILRDPRYNLWHDWNVFSIELFAQRFERANHRACRVHKIAPVWYWRTVSRGGGKEFRAARNQASDPDNSLRARRGASVLRKARLCANWLPVCEKSRIRFHLK